jgi:hypothetical protein
MVTHYEDGAFAGIDYAVFKSPCGAYSDRHQYTDRDNEVTCTKCLKALGYKVEEQASG